MALLSQPNWLLSLSLTSDLLLPFVRFLQQAFNDACAIATFKLGWIHPLPRHEYGRARRRGRRIQQMQLGGQMAASRSRSLLWKRYIFCSVRPSGRRIVTRSA